MYQEYLRDSKANIKRQGKARIDPGFKKFKIICEKKTFVRKFDAQCRCFRKEAVEMEQVSGMKKIQKELKFYHERQ